MTTHPLPTDVQRALLLLDRLSAPTSYPGLAPLRDWLQAHPLGADRWRPIEEAPKPFESHALSEASRIAGENLKPYANARLSTYLASPPLPAKPTWAKGEPITNAVPARAPVTPQSEAMEREAFERKFPDWKFATDDMRVYTNVVVRHAWIGWLARAALAHQPAATGAGERDDA
jgi:hypothetical protein